MIKNHSMSTIRRGASTVMVASQRKNATDAVRGGQMEKIYRVQMNSKGMPNFSTAVEIDTDISKYSDKLWKNAYERGKADRPQGEWIDMGDFEKCSVCKATHLKEFQSYYGKVTWIKTPYCPQCGARMKGADDENN